MLYAGPVFSNSSHLLQHSAFSLFNAVLVHFSFFFLSLFSPWPNTTDCQGSAAPPKHCQIQRRLSGPLDHALERKVGFKTKEIIRPMAVHLLCSLFFPCISLPSTPVLCSMFRGMIVLIVLEYCNCGSLQDYTRVYRRHLEANKLKPTDEAAGGLTEMAIAYIIREVLKSVWADHLLQTLHGFLFFCSSPAPDPLFLLPSFAFPEPLSTYTPSTSCIATSKAATCYFTTAQR